MKSVFGFCGKGGKDSNCVHDIGGGGEIEEEKETVRVRVSSERREAVRHAVQFSAGLQ